MPNRWVCTAVLAAVVVAGCTPSIRDTRVAPRLLNAGELDQVAAGSAAALGAAQAAGFGGAPDTSATAITQAVSGYSVAHITFFGARLPTAGVSNYASSQAIALSSGAPVSSAGGSIRVAVDGAGGGAAIGAVSNAAATAAGTTQAKVGMQFAAISIGDTDVAFGTALASACCGSEAFAQSDVEGTAGGAYRLVISANSSGFAPSQAESRVDIIVVSSMMPLLDPGLVEALGSRPMLPR